jgi:hypothetical protein
MCLERVNKVYKPMKDVSGTGWKVLKRETFYRNGESGGELRFPYSHQGIVWGKWMKRQWMPNDMWGEPEYFRVMCDESGVSYPVGFHVFTSYADAMDYRGSSRYYLPVQVDWRGLLAEGHQYINISLSGDSEKLKRTNCVITREIKFHEQQDA